jgi:regulator of protease activity HflC (stomatin/prohibitin superfamily)
MGSGVAKQIRGKWPEVFDKYKQACWTQEVSANYPVTDIFGDKRTQINAELDVYLREKFDQYGIIIDTVNFTDISVDAETAAAIQKKVTAQQELELANIEAQTAMVNANKEKEVAQVAAEKAVVEANAEAEVIRIAAEAEAEANRQIAASLTPELIEKIKYEQWDGKMPTVSGTGAIVSIDGVN